MTNSSSSIDEETEGALERLFADARVPAAKPNPLYDGRNIEDIDEDIATVRASLDIEL